ncbi:MAG: IS21 family transposase [Desulfobacterales bacterium]
MKGKKLPMRSIRKILEYRLELHISAEKTGLALNISKGSVINVGRRFKESGLSWPLSENMSDTELENKLYPVKAQNTPEKHLPDINYITKELARPHATLQRLWEEYKSQNPEGLCRSSFYRYINKSLPPKVYMKMHHKGGDKLFVDYSGDSLDYIDLHTGETKATQLFVCSWGASSYSYVEATESQKKHDFTSSHIRAFEYFDAVPHSLVPDNLKSAVTKVDRYNPLINRLFGLLCTHYNTVALPARVRKPQDKGTVESNVLHVQRTILFRLRNRQFFSLQELNDALREELRKYNNQPMKDYGGQSRFERFIAFEKPFAKPLSAERFALINLKEGVKVARDYHVAFEKRFYSVPWQYAGKRVEIRQCNHLLEIIYDNKKLCTHKVSNRQYSYTTTTEHMPPRHQFVRGWSAGYFLNQAKEIGPSVLKIVEIAMKRTEHAEQGFKTAMGILQLAKQYTPHRLEAACKRALVFNNTYCATIKTILKQNLDKAPLEQKNECADEPVVEHENIRGQSLIKR